MTGCNLFRGFIPVILVLCCFIIKGHTKGRPPLFKSRLIEIRGGHGRFQLFYKNQPFVVKGGAVTETTFLPYLKALGGNSVRTYSTENAQKILDSSQALGLKVMLGLRIGDAYKDFYPDNLQSRDSLREVVTKEVLKYRNHPALLIWSLGNEITLFMKKGLTELEKHILLWNYIDELAQMIHQIDPLHPVATAIPRRSFQTLRLLEVFTPNLDLIAFNAAEPLKDDELPFYCRRPFLISELSPPGYWNHDHTEWYARLEPGSSEKAKFIKHESDVYQAAGGLGAYAFYWGHKQEYTPTWFSLFTERGELTEAGYSFQNIWQESNSQIKNNITIISNVTIQNKKDQENIYLKTGQSCQVNFILEGRDIEKAEVRWELIRDEVDYLDASYFPKRLPVIQQDSIKSISLPKAFKLGKWDRKRNACSINLSAPEEEGAYRLFFYAKNSVSGIVSTANICFFVRE